MEECLDVNQKNQVSGTTESGSLFSNFNNSMLYVYYNNLYSLDVKYCITSISIFSIILDAVYFPCKFKYENSQNIFDFSS